MSSLTRHSLSSACLYHFKPEIRVLKLILQHGFSHRLMIETIPYKESKQQNFAVCFCDIRWEDSAAHRSCYGDNAIVLTKAWGIANGISPVRYIHQNSPGATEAYIAIRNMLRFARDASEGDQAVLVRNMLILSLLKDEGTVLGPDVANAFALNPIAEQREGELESEIDRLLSATKSGGHAGLVLRYIQSLVARIIEQQNELEFRDSYTRRYQEDFACPRSRTIVSDKRLYAEREWRSIKYVTDAQAKASPGLVESALTNRFLPPSYNLDFGDSDVVALIVADDVAKADIMTFLGSGVSLLGTSFRRVYTTAEFD